LDLLHKYATTYELPLWAYCLMPNHVHFVAVPRREDSMARALGRTNADYARYFNVKRASCGHVWQARFFSCPLDGSHLWRAVAYVERNPVRAGLSPVAEAYRWSSAAARIKGYSPLLDLRVWWADYTGAQWLEVLKTTVAEEAFGRRLAEATVRGRPMGAAAFTQELEDLTGRRIEPSKPGRPRKLAAGAEIGN
jgi:putative transposase